MPTMLRFILQKAPVMGFILLAERSFTQSQDITRHVIIGQGLSVLEIPGEDALDPITVDEVNWQMQNPVSGLRRLFLADVFQSFEKGNTNKLLIQPGWSLRVSGKWNLITYAGFPFQSIPPLNTGKGPASGLGNILLNTFFSPYEISDHFGWGAGMQVSFPTRSDPALGSNSFGIGPTALFYYNAQLFACSLRIEDNC
jgi:hypothetical protein